MTESLGKYHRIRRLILVILWLGMGSAIAYFALYTRMGMALDGLSRYAVAEGQELFFGLDFYILSIVSIPVLVAVMALAALVAVLRKRWALAGRAIIMLCGANLSTRLLKYYVFSRAAIEVDYPTSNSLPSGHTTAAVSAAIALLIVVPHAWRDIVTWLGWFLTVMMAVAVMANHWHRLSDVLVAICVSAVWALALTPVEKRQSKKRIGMTAFTLLAVLSTIAGTLIMLWAWWQLSENYQGDAAINLSGSGLQILAGTQMGQATALGSLFSIFAMSALALRVLNAQAR